MCVIARLRSNDVFDAGTLMCKLPSQIYYPTIAVDRYQTGTCKAEEVMTSEKKDYLMNVVMPNVLPFFQASLSVRPIIGNLALSPPYLECESTSPSQM